MSEIIAYVKRNEPGTLDDRTPCACRTIIVGLSIVRRVGNVEHGALACVRHDPPPDNAPDADDLADYRQAEREAINDYEATRGIERG